MSRRRRAPAQVASSGSVGVRFLKDRASAVLRRVRGGESIVVTDRNEPVALLVPYSRASTAENVRRLAEAGRLAWSGGKPAGSARPPRVRGRSVADAVVEDRR